MAQSDNEKGAVLAGQLMSAHWYPKGTNLAIYPGDFVIVNSAGNVVKATAGSIELLGVALSHEPAVDTEVLVSDDPDQEYYIRDDGVGGTLAATNVGNNLDIVTTTGSATYLRSNMQADTSTVGTSTAQLRILDKHPDDSWADNVRLLVVINEHTWAKKLAGV